MLDGNLPHADVACVLKSMSMTPISAAPAGMRCDVQKEVLEGQLIAVLRDAPLAAEESAADKAIKKTECAMRDMLLGQTPNILHAPLKNTLSSLRLVMEKDEKINCSAEDLQSSWTFLCSPDCCLHRHNEFLSAFHRCDCGISLLVCSDAGRHNSRAEAEGLGRASGSLRLSVAQQTPDAA